MCVTALLAVALATVGACGGSDPSPRGDATNSRSGSQPAPGGTARGESGTAEAEACEPAAEPVAPEGPSAEAVVLQAADGDRPGVDAVVYPRPDHQGNPWSQWGQGLVLPDGRFVSAIGDHLGRDGNSYLFLYEPGNRRLTRFADVLSRVSHEEGDWGYGKIHGQMVAGGCGELFLSTYWGSDKGIEYGGSYTGDLLFRLDTATLALEPLGAPVPEHGIPSLAGSTGNRLVYGEAVLPVAKGEGRNRLGAFFVYDVAGEEVVFRADDERLNGFRNVIVTGDGTAYVSTGNRLLVYEPGASELELHPEALPAGRLRASTSPAPDGTVYGVTEMPNRLFALRPDGDIEDLGAAEGYTTSLALHPDGGRFFYVPGAHGDSFEQGTPLVAVDTATGEHTTVVELNELAEQELGLTLGGSYSVAVDPSGDRVYVGLNAGTDRDDPWGEVVLVVVELP